jgi:2,3-dihydro-2,3-dihydroxybenzoate dehydrogenase
MSLAGRCALVTGAARGIGFVIARVLAQQGMSLALNDLEPEATEAAALRLRNEGGQAVAIPADLRRAPDVFNLFEQVEHQFGPLWLLVNNAGVYRPGAAENLSEHDWDETFAVDAKAVFLCSQAAVRCMIPRQGGRIIVVSSIAGVITRTDQIAYCAAKAAAVHFSRCLAIEVARHKITVNCVCPGMTDSRMLRETAVARGIEIHDYVAMVPAGRLAEPEDHARTIAWLASDEAQHITGQVIAVDGGQSIYHPVARDK